MMDMLDIAEKHTTGPAYPTEISAEPPRKSEFKQNTAKSDTEGGSP